jgi:prophage regulatory protein
MPRFVSYPELKSHYGIGYSRKYIIELVRMGLFPAPVNLGSNSIAWIDTELDDWSAARIAARDNPSPETVAARKARSQKIADRNREAMRETWRRRKAEAARLERMASKAKPKLLATKARKRISKASSATIEVVT